jgi:hypothetical protein
MANMLCIRFEFLTMKSIIFWEMVPSNLAEVYRCFWTTYCLYLQGQWVSQASRVSCVQRKWCRSPEKTNMSKDRRKGMTHSCTSLLVLGSSLWTPLPSPISKHVSQTRLALPAACFPYSLAMKMEIVLFILWVVHNMVLVDMPLEENAFKSHFFIHLLTQKIVLLLHIFVRIGHILACVY